MIYWSVHGVHLVVGRATAEEAPVLLVLRERERLSVPTVALQSLQGVKLSEIELSNGIKTDRLDVVVT